MKAPHNHAQWQALKEQKVSERAEKKRKATSRKAASSETSTRKKGSKLALSKSFKTTLTTSFCCSERDAETLFSAM